MRVTKNDNDNASEKTSDEAIWIQAIYKSMLSIEHKFLFISSQGGVGKTIAIVKLAMAISKKGIKVGLMDMNFNNPDLHRLLSLEPTTERGADNRLSPMAYSDDLKVASIQSVIQGTGDTGGWENLLKISDILRFMSGINWNHLGYLFVDTPPGPSVRLLSVIRAIPDVKVIIVSAPDKISYENAKNIISFFRKEKISIFGWIENMSGFLCQNCGQRQEIISTGPVNRAIFLNEVPFLGRIPINSTLEEFNETREAFPEKHRDYQTAEAYNFIIKKIMQNN